MSAPVKGKTPANLGEATRACLFAVVDRFNTDEPFWGSFVPVADLTEIGRDTFRVSFQGRGVLITVRGQLIRKIGENLTFTPSLVVGAAPPSDPSSTDEPKPIEWHPVDCSVGDDGKFVTSNFRTAIESAIADIS